MKSIIARLEALESRSGKNLVLCVTLKDGSTREMGVAEFKQLKELGEIELAHGGDCVRILSGNNYAELDEYLEIMMGKMADIMNNPAPNRNIEDYE